MKPAVIISVHIDSKTAFMSAGIWKHAALALKLDPEKAVIVKYDADRSLFLVCLTEHGSGLLSNPSLYLLVAPAVSLPRAVSRCLP